MVVVTEVSVHSFSEARFDKIAKYGKLRDNASNVKDSQCILTLFSWVAFGSFDPENIKFLSRLNLPPTHLVHFLRFLCSQVINVVCTTLT